MENTTEESKVEARLIPINYSISIEDRVHDLGIHLEDGIKIEDLVKMDKVVGAEKRWELERVKLNQGRLYPRRISTLGIIESNYEYGVKLEKERGITPTELFSLLIAGEFKELRGVYILSPWKECLLLLDLKGLNLQRHYIDDLPNHANAKFYAFPTIEMPKEK